MHSFYSINKIEYFIQGKRVNVRSIHRYYIIDKVFEIVDKYGKRLKPKAKESSILSRVELYFDDKIYKYKTQESIDNFIKGISKILKSDTILIDSK